MLDAILCKNDEYIDSRNKAGEEWSNSTDHMADVELSNRHIEITHIRIKYGEISWNVGVIDVEETWGWSLTGHHLLLVFWNRYQGMLDFVLTMEYGMGSVSFYT